MFTRIKYLEMQNKDLDVYKKMLSRLLGKIAKEQTSLRVNGEVFRQNFTNYITLLEDTYTALNRFK